MFKDLGNYLEKKKSLLSKSQNKNQEIKEGLRIFLENEFGPSIKGFSFIINYNQQDDTLTIGTENKVLANELVVRLADINDFLQNRKIKLTRVLIR